MTGLLAAMLADADPADPADPAEPGVVGTPHWRPDDPFEHQTGSHTGGYVAVARVP